MTEFIPSKFFLSQNSPNPFTVNTKIKYCLPVKTQVFLTVFNSEGELVMELVNKIQDAGTYEIKFEGFDLTSNEYYYKLLVRDTLKKEKDIFNKKKMIFVR